METFDLDVFKGVCADANVSVDIASLESLDVITDEVSQEALKDALESLYSRAKSGMKRLKTKARNIVSKSTDWIQKETKILDSLEVRVKEVTFLSGNVDMGKNTPSVQHKGGFIKALDETTATLSKVIQNSSVVDQVREQIGKHVGKPFEELQKELLKIRVSALPLVGLTNKTKMPKKLVKKYRDRQVDAYDTSVPVANKDFFVIVDDTYAIVGDTTEPRIKDGVVPALKRAEALEAIRTVRKLATLIEGYLRFLTGISADFDNTIKILEDFDASKAYSKKDLNNIFTELVHVANITLVPSYLALRQSSDAFSVTVSYIRNSID